MPLGQFGVEGLEELANSGHGADIALDGKGFFVHCLDFTGRRRLRPRRSSGN